MSCHFGSGISSMDPQGFVVFENLLVPGCIIDITRLFSISLPKIQVTP